jgi:histidine triad (HIT) family protein
MAGEPGCVFCRILSGELPCHEIHRDEHTIVFMDIAPVTDGHTLVVTREHHENLYDATPEALAGVMATAKRVAHAMRKALSPEGLMVFQLNGAAAGQTVFHYHMHLMPRASGEPLALHARVPGDPARLADLASRIRAALEAGSRTRRSRRRAPTLRGSRSSRCR